MKNLFLVIIFQCISVFSFSQAEIKGTIKDESTNETIVGATVLISEGKGAVTDIDGNFSIKVDDGEYTLTISYIGYDLQKVKVKVSGKSVAITVALKTTILNEVEVVADVAKTRETPIAFSNISTKQIQEELGTRDLPMILNSTPGVYATEQGGGSGDARVTIRGFDQRNVAVMVDGVPVNDMENGQVYWSNWDGLGDITRTMQVQRGLGASKLAIASVGGTINIITKGIDQKMSGGVKQEVNDFGLYKTSFGFNTGQLKGDWGLTVAGSRKWGDNWADGTFTDAFSYFLKVQKRFKNHLFSLSGNGAPQKHGQRSDRMPIGVYNKALSDKLGLNTDSILTSYHQVERGLRYNPNWGVIDGYDVAYRGNSFPKVGNENEFNEAVNFYHKPQFNLSHFWTASEKLTVSNVLYLSIGKGGGTSVRTSPGRDTETGLLNIQKIYNDNMKTLPDPRYHETEHPSSNYLYASNNDHVWYGLLSSWNYQIDTNFTTLFGIDARYYKGTHYRSVYDLMGGDYVLDKFSDANQINGSSANKDAYKNAIRRVGDKLGYYNDAIVMWGGAFAQVEYKKNKWSTFLTASVSQTGYQRIDYYKKKDFLIDGQTFEQALGTGDALFYNGKDHIIANAGSQITTSGDTTFVGSGANKKYILNATKYTNQSSGARHSTTKQKWFLGYTFKGGANYNINDHHNVFLNLGYLNMAPKMNVVYDINNKEYLNIKHQKVYAIEAGYGLKDTRYAANLNMYYTVWQNKPLTGSVPNPDSPIPYSYNIQGLHALHKGIEIDFIYKFLKNLDFEGLISLGDWKTTSASTTDIIDQDGNLIKRIDFSAKNVHVGDAAQIQYAGSIRYEIIKNLYIKPRYTFFAKNYANFDPTTLTGDDRDRESWKLPNYGVMDLFAGYEFKKIWKMRISLTAGVNNVLNTVYISDAQNNFLMPHNFDAASAGVYMGMGRRVSASLRIGF